MKYPGNKDKTGSGIVLIAALAMFILEFFRPMQTKSGQIPVKAKILILCTGNSVRSQLTHGFLQSFDDRIKVVPAGIQPADRVNRQAVETMAGLGIDIGSHTPEPVDKYLHGDWDYVITVCDNANEKCPVFPGKVKNRLHFDVDNPKQAEGTPEFIQSEYHRVANDIKEVFWKLYSEKLQPQLE
jgi:arsenate reductase (thioredoxin)